MDLALGGQIGRLDAGRHRYSTGKIHSLDDLITVYEPELKGTAWDGVTLKQLIQHTSGVEWNEDYTNPQSHFARLTQCEAQPGAYDCVRKNLCRRCRANIRQASSGPTLPRRLAAGRCAGTRDRYVAGRLA